MDFIAIISGLRNHKKDVFKELVYQYSGKLMVVAKIYTRSPEDAKDVLQDSLIVIFQKAHDFVGSDEKAFVAWMKKIVRNTGISRYQRKYYSHENANIETTQEQAIHPAVYSQFSQDEIMKMVFSLPMGYRQVFALYAIEGFSHKEIAEKLDIKESSSRSQYVRARQMLQKRILEITKITA